MLIDWLFKFFSKDYAPKKTKKCFVIQECIVPFTMARYDRTIKINLYTRKTKHIHTYINPFLKPEEKIEYSGVIHAVITFKDGSKEEHSFEFQKGFYRNDLEFAYTTSKKYF